MNHFILRQVPTIKIIRYADTKIWYHNDIKNKKNYSGFVVNREFHFVRRNVLRIEHCRYSHNASERRKYTHPSQSKRNLVVASITFRNDALILKCYPSI